MSRKLSHVVFICDETWSIRDSNKHELVDYNNSRLLLVFITIVVVVVVVYLL